MNSTSKYCLNYNHLNYKDYIPNDNSFKNIAPLLTSYRKLSNEKKPGLLLSLYNNILNEINFMQLILDIILLKNILITMIVLKKLKGLLIV